MFLRPLILCALTVFTTGQNCLSSGCPSGISCDSNTGVCRQFRTAYAGPVQISCGVCPSGSMCDSNTGTCRQFRTAGVGGTSTSRCAAISCPVGTICDENTGTCQSFRTPAITGSTNMYNPSSVASCSGVVCPSGQTCDVNSGTCRGFRTVGRRKRNAEKCGGVECSDGFLCDASTGLCRQFRPAVGGGVTRDDLCGNVACPQGTSCDTNTGLCRQFRPAVGGGVTRDDLCGNVACPQGTSCDMNTGRCVSVENQPFVCPLRSHLEQCAAACPATCINSSPQCRMPCITTCTCDNGLIQASPTNTSCISPNQCGPQLSKCNGVSCGSDMKCYHGFCNPINCPDIVMPNLRPGCGYVLMRNVNNCLTYTLECL